MNDMLRKKQEYLVAWPCPNYYAKGKEEMLYSSAMLRPAEGVWGFTAVTNDQRSFWTTLDALDYVIPEWRQLEVATLREIGQAVNVARLKRVELV